MEKDMSKKEKKEKVFNLEDFYRKVGVGLLLLLLTLILILGSIMLVIQNKILQQTNANLIEKSKITLIDPNSVKSSNQVDESDKTVPPSGEETPVLDEQDVTE